mgnify:CR=1 FL=1
MPLRSSKPEANRFRFRWFSIIDRFIAQTNSDSGGSNFDFFVNDIALVIIPEPGTVALLGVGALVGTTAAFARRRRSRN